MYGADHDARIVHRRRMPRARSQDGMVSLFSWLDQEAAVLVARELELPLW